MEPVGIVVTVIFVLLLLAAIIVPQIERRQSEDGS